MNSGIVQKDKVNQDIMDHPLRYDTPTFDEGDHPLRTAKKKRRTSVQFEDDHDQDVMNNNIHNSGGFHLRLQEMNTCSNTSDVHGSSFASPIPELKRSNFNPFAHREQPSLISVSTGDASPEPGLNSSCLSIMLTSDENSEGSPAMATQTQLCKDFKKTLSFVEMMDEEATTDALRSDFEELPASRHGILSSPSTPPSSSNGQLRQFPQSVVKSRIHHRLHTAENQTSWFENEFEILGQLGGGSFGTVFKVRKRLDGCMYAVKVVNQSFSGKTGRERVLKEVYALSALVNNSDNSHVLRYFTSWIDADDRLYIQTELCDWSLEDLLKTRNHQASPKDQEVEEVACEILRQLLEGLKYLHGSNVVHLDIKPANILVRNGTYKLGDLGHVAKARAELQELPEPPESSSRTSRDFDEEDERQIRAANSVANDVDEGDVRYMARELLNECRDHLPKADIFSLAASIYEMFLQKPLPLNGSEWLALREGHLAPEATSKMSPNFRQLMHLMLHPDPAKRPTADALLLTGGPGGILLPQETLKRQAELRRGFHPAHAVLKRANTM